MNSDITRQVSASLYQNRSLRDRFFQFAKDPYHAVVESYGMNTTEVLKHLFNARRGERSYYQRLFIPALLLWYFLLSVFMGGAGSGTLLLTFICFLVAFLLVILRDVNQREFLKENLSKGSYNADFQYDKTNSQLISNFEARTGGKAVFYSGYSPFVGSGLDIGGWSFVVDIDKGKKVMENRLVPSHFEESELYQAITKELDSLSIPKLTVFDRVFINGKKIRDNKELLPDIVGHPVNNVPAEYIEMVKNNDVKDARFYKTMQVIDWEGDLVLTAFFRLQRDYKSLFIENNYYLLPPIGDNMKAIDAIKQYSGIRHFFAWIFGLVLVTFKDTLLSIFKVFSYISTAISDAITGGEEAVQRKLVKSSPDYDYGASTSLREAVSQRFYSQHFQKLDKERYFKIIEKRIFHVIADFLESRNIDVSEFRERETSILNNGIIVTGGNLSGENIGVGKGSKINIGKGKKESK